MNKEEDYMNGIESITYGIIGGAIVTKKVQLSWLIDESENGVGEVDIITCIAINGVMTKRKVQVFMNYEGGEWFEFPEDMAEEMFPLEEDEKRIKK